MQINFSFASRKWHGFNKYAFAFFLQQVGKKGKQTAGQSAQIMLLLSSLLKRLTFPFQKQKQNRVLHTFFCSVVAQNQLKTCWFYAAWQTKVIIITSRFHKAWLHLSSNAMSTRVPATHYWSILDDRVAQKSECPTLCTGFGGLRVHVSKRVAWLEMWVLLYITQWKMVK